MVPGADGPHHPAHGCLEAAGEDSGWKGQRVPACAQHTAENRESTNPLPAAADPSHYHEQALHWPSKNSVWNRDSLYSWPVLTFGFLSLSSGKLDQLLFAISSAWCWVLATSLSSLHENNLSSTSWISSSLWWGLMFSSWFLLCCVLLFQNGYEVAKTKPYIVYIKLAYNKSTLEMWCLGWDDHIKALQG